MKQLSQLKLTFFFSLLNFGSLNLLCIRKQSLMEVVPSLLEEPGLQLQIFTLSFSTGSNAIWVQSC